MTERLADLREHIGSVRELRAVINAIRGMAAARAQHAREQLAAVDSYTQTIAEGIGRALALKDGGAASASAAPGRGGAALVVFCAEQGFAGAFSERVLDALRGDAGHAALFLLGTRGQMVAAERDLPLRWWGPMPAHAPGMPRLADQIAEALYAGIARGEFDRLDVVYSIGESGQGIRIERRCLFPLEWSAFRRAGAGSTPMHNLAPADLLNELAAAYLHAQLCHAGLHAFAAENAARMEAMAAAHAQIERKLAELDGREHQVRQAEITDEILELASGEAASRADGGAR